MNKKFVRNVKTTFRWLFVVITWLISVVLIYDFWSLFRNFTWMLFLESSLPVIIGLALCGLVILLAVFRYTKLLQFIVVILFFLSVALLYSYVGKRLANRLTSSFGTYEKKTTLDS